MQKFGFSGQTIEIFANCDFNRSYTKADISSFRDDVDARRGRARAAVQGRLNHQIDAFSLCKFDRLGYPQAVR
jgi:hypothetical protein